MSAWRSAYESLPRPTLYGHRGSRTSAPENTLAAIELAAREGADAVEIDVRPTRDGELVVMHDPTLLRTVGDPRSVGETTRAELGDLRIEGHAIPTLEDVHGLCVALGLGLNVELKRDVPSRPAAVALLAQALRRLGPGCGLVVSSFDPAMLLALRVLAPEVPRALLLEPASARRYRHARFARDLGVAVHLDHEMASPAAIAGFHAQGLRVVAWTVNSGPEAGRLCALGLDGIITDVPAAARRSMNKFVRPESRGTG